jgi:hypothetical protein
MQVEYEIYRLTAPGCWYVGATTIGAQRRFQRHLAGRGGAKKLYEKIQELGTEAFELTVIERGSGNPTTAEQRCYDECLAGPGESLNGQRPGCYPPRAGQPAWNRGISPSEETRTKRRATAKATRRAKTECGKGHRYERWNIPFPGTLRCRQCNIDRCKARRDGLN